MSQTMNVVVTGANRGIGKAICEAILKSSSIPSVKLYACSRQGKDLGLPIEKGKTSVVYQKLDIANRKSIDELAASIDESKEQIDVLLNNAGINLDREASLEIAKTTLGVNYYGTLNMCQTLIPRMRSGGRIVNVSSIASVLKLYQEHVRQRFREAKTLQDLEQMASEYLHAVEQNKEESTGFGVAGRSYNVSKALLNGATRVLATENKDLQINSCCPGWIDTDMGALVGKPSKTPAQGATIPMRLAFGDIGNVSGQFWANSSVSSTEAGRVQKP